MISVYILWIDWWTLKKWKTAKAQNYVLSAYYSLPPGSFFPSRFLNMCKPRTTFYVPRDAGPPRVALYGSGPKHLPSRLGMIDEGWLASIQSEVFSQVKFIIFQGCPTNQASFLPGYSAPYNNVTNITLLLKFKVKSFS